MEKEKAKEIVDLAVQLQAAASAAGLNVTADGALLAGATVAGHGVATAWIKDLAGGKNGKPK